METSTADNTWIEEAKKQLKTQREERKKQENVLDGETNIVKLAKSLIPLTNKDMNLDESSAKWLIYFVANAYLVLCHRYKSLWQVIGKVTDAEISNVKTLAYYETFKANMRFFYDKVNIDEIADGKPNVLQIEALLRLADKDIANAFGHYITVRDADFNERVISDHPMSKQIPYMVYTTRAFDACPSGKAAVIFPFAENRSSEKMIPLLLIDDGQFHNLNNSALTSVINNRGYWYRNTYVNQLLNKPYRVTDF